MKIVAVVGPSQARGLRLAGLEAFDGSDARLARERLRSLTHDPEIGLVLLSLEVAAAAPGQITEMRGAEPPLAVVIPDPEAR